MEYVVLSETDTAHHVVIRRAGEAWLHVVATFARRDRADDYADLENMFVREAEADGSHERFEAADAAPARLPPPAGATVDRFARPAAAERPETPERPPASAPKLLARPPAPPAARPLDEEKDDAGSAETEQRTRGGRFMRPPEEELRPKPVTSGWSTARDPLLHRNGEAPKAVELPKGSRAQQLADRIAADLDSLIAEFGGGPTLAEVAERYGESAVRARDAAHYLTKNRVARLSRFDGETADRLVRMDSDTPPASNSKARIPNSVDHDGRRKSVLDVLRAAADGDRVQMSLGRIAQASGVPQGSMSFLLTALVDEGALSLVEPGSRKSPAVYRINPAGVPAA